MVNLLTSIVAIAVVFFLVVAIRFPKKFKHYIYGTLLLMAGLMPLLNYLGIILWTIPDIPLVKYVLNLVIAVTGGTLVWEAIKERSAIRWPTAIIGAAIVAMSIIPTLYNAGAVSFNIPKIPEMIIYIIRMVGGILLILAVFLVGE